MQKWCKLLKDKENAQRVHKCLIAILTLSASRVTVTPAEMKTIRPEAYIGGKILSLIFSKDSEVLKSFTLDDHRSLIQWLGALWRNVAPVLSYTLYHQQHLACISSVWFWIHDYVLSIIWWWQILTIELCHFLDTKHQLIAPWLIDFKQLRRIEVARLAANRDHTEKTSSSSRTSGRNHWWDHLEAFDAIFVLLNLWLLLIFQ